jgi:hypothetical protein
VWSLVTNLGGTGRRRQEVSCSGVRRKNLLTRDEATFETGSVPATFDDFWGDGLIVATSIEQAAEGERSLKVTAPYNDIYLEFDIADVPVVAGQQYTAHASVYPTVNGEEIFLSMMFTNASHGSIVNGAQYGPTFNSVAGAWVNTTHTVVAPANAAFCRLRFAHHLDLANQSFYVDKFGLWKGATTNWERP